MGTGDCPGPIVPLDTRLRSKKHYHYQCHAQKYQFSISDATNINFNEKKCVFFNFWCDKFNFQASSGCQAGVQRGPAGVKRVGGKPIDLWKAWFFRIKWRVKRVSSGSEFKRVSSGLKIWFLSSVGQKIWFLSSIGLNICFLSLKWLTPDGFSRFLSFWGSSMHAKCLRWGSGKGFWSASHKNLHRVFSTHRGNPHLPLISPGGMKASQSPRASHNMKAC